MNSSQKVEFFLKKGILIEPDLVDEVDESIMQKLENEDVMVLDRKKLNSLKKKEYSPIVNRPAKVEIIKNYQKEPQERNINDFIQYFNHRYSTLSRILKQRQELNNLSSIKRVAQKEGRETTAVIGMVRQKRRTKNDHIMLEVEDQTGKIKVLISKNNPELLEVGKDIVNDEVIGITGTSGDDIIFADNIIFPDIPLSHELKKSPEEEYAVFISDVEVGSVNFIKEGFEKFIKWIRGETGDPRYKKIARKIKYLFVVGDLVAGVGIYPGQDDELEIKDIRDQYKKFEEYMNQIPDHIQIVLCAGNHDAGRITEPQLPQYKDFTEDFKNRKNVTLVSNPSYVRIGEKPGFSGFDVLLYHGYSIPYYADNIETIRSAGGQKRSDLIMEFYLKRRHLSPSHGCNMYIPDRDEDPMVIDLIPDFLATGHIHRTAVGNYKGVTMMNCSAWTAPTEYQINRGLVPEPGRVVLTNLKTRKVRILKFYKDEMQQ